MFSLLPISACTFELAHLGGKLVSTHFVVNLMNKCMILKVTCSLFRLPLSAWTCVFTHFQPVSHHVDVLSAILILHHQQFDLYIWLDFWNMISMIINMVCRAFQLHFWTYKFSVSKLIYLLFWCITEWSVTLTVVCSVFICTSEIWTMHLGSTTGKCI